MAKKAAFITVHGMGRTDPDYHRDLVADLEERLGPLAEALHFGSVYYQGILQPNEDRVWDRLGRKVKWDELRRFLLFGFADAAGLESGKDGQGCDYWLAQQTIARELLAAQTAMAGDGPLVILAHSLGAQVVSCYFWDANVQPVATVGVWQDIGEAAGEIASDGALSDTEIEFLRGGSLHTLVTTGCNIPIFVAAHAKEDILPIQPNANFRWHNYYDKDDVLGWPLSDLSDEYGRVVIDHPINAASGIMGWLLKSWNPMSHTQYWADDDFVTELEALLRPLLR